jgi:hypothetical protein
LNGAIAIVVGDAERRHLPLSIHLVLQQKNIENN